MKIAFPAKKDTVVPHLKPSILAACFVLLLCGGLPNVSLGETVLEPREAEQAWAKALRLQRAQLNSVRSYEMSYVIRRKNDPHTTASLRSPRRR